METICWDYIAILRHIQPIYWDLYMETHMHVETRLRWQDPPQNQRDRKLKRLWRGVKFRLASTDDQMALNSCVLAHFGWPLWSKRVNEINEAMIEVGKIPGGDGKSVDPRDGGDLTVKIAQGTAEAFSVSLDFSKHPRRRLIEVQQPGRKCRSDESLESVFKQPAAPTLGHGVQAEANLRDRDRSHVQRCRLLPIHPFQHRCRGWRCHEFRDNMGVKDNHSGNSIGSLDSLGGN